jgi:hypothetical protein
MQTVHAAPFARAQAQKSQAPQTASNEAKATEVTAATSQMT